MVTASRWEMGTLQHSISGVGASASRGRSLLAGILPPPPPPPPELGACCSASLVQRSASALEHHRRPASGLAASSAVFLCLKNLVVAVRHRLVLLCLVAPLSVATPASAQVAGGATIGELAESPESNSIFACRPRGLVSAGESCQLHGTAVVFDVDSLRSRACLATDAHRFCGNVVVVHRGTLDNTAIAFEAHRERNGIWRLSVVEPSPGENGGPEVAAHAARAAPLTLNVGDDPAERELSSIFQDPEQEPLRYDAEASSDVVAVSVVDGTLTIRPLRQGSTEVMVTAIDRGGMTATWRFAVAVDPALSNASLPLWAWSPIAEAGSSGIDSRQPSVVTSSNIAADVRSARVRTHVVRTLATTHRHGGCMAELDISLGETGLNCPGSWVAFSCDGTHASRTNASRMFRDAQLAFGFGSPVSVSLTEHRKHNGHCVANRIDVFK